MNDIDLLAVLVASVASFAFGALWYSKPLFLDSWIAANEAEPEPSPPVFALGFAATLVSATAFAVWLGESPGLGEAVIQGLVVGGCLVAASLGINYPFAGRSPLLWLIDGGFHTARFALIGAVLALWP